jgi:hypothetical protein
MVLVALLSFLVFFFVPEPAFAWGPATHLRYASEVLVNLDMLGPSLRMLLAAYPYDFLYGNLAADLILGKKYIDYRLHCHNWDVGFEVLAKAQGEPQRAFVWGYITHLAADTIAHNIFIPSQVLRDDAPRGFKHAYWEVRYDSRAEKPIWDLAAKIQRLVHPGNDELLQAQLEETIFSHRVNKVIFDSLLLVQNMKQWQQAVSTLGDRSTWQFHRVDSLRYDNLVMDSIFDMLLHAKSSHTYHNDPTGQRMLDLAVRLHKEGRRLRRDPAFDKDAHFRELAPILEFDFPAKHWSEKYPDRHPGSGITPLSAFHPAALLEKARHTIENPVGDLALAE